MKLEFAQQNDSDWSSVLADDPDVPEDTVLENVWAARMTGTTKEGKKFILHVLQDEDGVMKIQIVKGKIRVDPMVGRVEVIGNEF